MSKKKHLFSATFLYTITIILLFPSMTLLAKINAEQLLDLLNEKDQISNSVGYIISYQVLTKANMFDPNQGLVIMDCTVTRTGQAFAMKITYNYEHPPIFAHLGTRDYQPIDYDQEGNLIVWRTLEKYILFAPDRNDTLKKLMVFFVDPNDQIVKKRNNIGLHRFSIGDRNNMYEFSQYELATGRGFSKNLGTVTSAKTLPSGLMKVTSKGSYRRGPQGNWELTLDPNSDNIVREATFIPEWMDRPIVEVTSSGVIEKDGIKIAKYGTVKFSNVLELSVEVTDISKVVGANKLYEEVLSRLTSPLPIGASILDMRSEKPVRTTVK